MHHATATNRIDAEAARSGQDGAIVAKMLKKGKAKKARLRVSDDGLL